MTSPAGIACACGMPACSPGSLSPPPPPADTPPTGRRRPSRLRVDAFAQGCAPAGRAPRQNPDGTYERVLRWGQWQMAAVAAVSASGPAIAGDPSMHAQPRWLPASQPKLPTCSPSSSALHPLRHRYPNGQERRIRYPLPPPDDLRREDLTDGCWGDSCWEPRAAWLGLAAGGGEAGAARGTAAPAEAPADFVSPQNPPAEVRTCTCMHATCRRRSSGELQ